MKKIIALIIASIMMLSVFSMFAFAEDTTTYLFAADGVISEGEYVTCVEMNAENAKTWTGGTMPTSVKYYLGASRDTLLDSRFHVAIVTPKATFQDGYNFQINIGEGIDASKPGLFLSFILKADSVQVLQHNHKTKLLADDNAQGADITALIDQISIVDDGTNIVMEAFLPNALFIICDEANDVESYTYPEKMKIGFFAVLAGNGYSLCDATFKDWSIAGLGVDKSLVKVLPDEEEKKKETVSGVEIWDYVDASPVGNSFDTFYVGKDKINNFIMENVDGMAGQKLNAYMLENDYINGRETAFTTFTFRGWAGFADKILNAGYQFDNQDPVMVSGSLKTTEDGVRAAGGQYASRFEVEVDVTSLQDGREHEVNCVLELESSDDGSKYYVYMNQDGYAMYFVYLAPGDTPVPTATPAPTDTPVPTDTPDVTDAPAATDAPKATEAPTDATEKPADEKKSGCGSVVAGSVLAVALVGVVVFVKRKEN